MSGAVNSLVALLVGLSSGAIFFGGLWWTVRRGTVARNPAAWFPISLLLRTSLVVVGFYCVAAHGWRSLLLCTVGILISRELSFRLLRTASFSAHAT